MSGTEKYSGNLADRNKAETEIKLQKKINNINE
jgi:hypothetical protein